MGIRILVDRLWPRGLAKERAGIDEWCIAVAPSPKLRKWYAHELRLFEEFSRRYRTEIEAAAALGRLHTLAGHGRLTLLIATKGAQPH